MGIISVEHTNQLFWLGRYSERVYTTLNIFADRFDSMIDLDTDKYEEFCLLQEIPNIYTSKEDFASRYCFDERDPNSVYSNLIRAYDNAIVLREEIGSLTLSYIQLAVYAMNKAKESPAPLLELQHVRDNIVAFWGIVDDSIDLERIDLYARMRMDDKEMRREVARLNFRIERTGLSYSRKKLAHINYLVEDAPICYGKLVEEIESLCQC